MAPDLRSARRAEHTVAQWTTCLLFACLLLEAGTLASTFSQRAERPIAAAQNDVRRPTLATLKLAALLATGIAWLVWLGRAYRNLALVGSKRSRFTPRQAVGYWFIPFVNLVLGYQVMKDLWLRSDSMNDRDAYDDLPAPALLSRWWGMSLTWAALPLLASTVRNARSMLELVDVSDVSLVGSVIGIVATGLAIGVVRGIDQRQQCFSSSAPELPTPSRAAGAAGAAGAPGAARAVRP
jgi:hypothetical protein